MTQPQQTYAKHLPSNQQNNAYILTLIAATTLELCINTIIYQHSHKVTLSAKELFPIVHHTLEVSGFLFSALLALLGLNITHSLMRHQHRSRKSLLALGACSGAYLLTSLLTVGYAMYVFEIQSYWLLVNSILAYLSVIASLTFWYWYIDYPSQLHRAHHPGSGCEIEFPMPNNRGEDWLPSFLDYLYFTVTTSNTLGAPENHSPNGSKAKALLMVHSVSMMILLVIFVARAINTLN